MAGIVVSGSLSGINMHPQTFISPWVLHCHLVHPQISWRFDYAWRNMHANVYVKRAFTCISLSCQTVHLHFCWSVPGSLSLTWIIFNSSPSSSTYMRQWIRPALVQIIACRQFGAKTLCKPIWVIVNWTLRNKLQWNFSINWKIFIRKNASDNIVCEMVAILSRGRWVNLS